MNGDETCERPLHHGPIKKNVLPHRMFNKLATKIQNYILSPLKLVDGHGINLTTSSWLNLVDRIVCIKSLKLYIVTEEM